MSPKSKKIIDYSSEVSVRFKDLKYININIFLIFISFCIIILSSLVLYLIVTNGYDAIIEKTEFNYTLIWAHISAMVVGFGFFGVIMAVSSMLNDYQQSKKKAIDDLIERQQERERTSKKTNIFDALALNMKRFKQVDPK